MKKNTDYYCDKCKSLIREWLTTKVVFQENNSLHFCKRICYEKYHKLYNPYVNYNGS